MMNKKIKKIIKFLFGNFSIIISVSGIIILISFLVLLPIKLENNKIEYCNSIGYDYAENNKFESGETPFRCCKEIPDESGIGYRIEKTGIIKYEDIE